jgi:Holliday junction resolvase-like predicted endonuclease
MATSPLSDADIDRTAKYLQKLGYTELDRRWQAPDGSGEAGIIAASRSVLAIGTISFGGPCLGRIVISGKRVRHLRGLARAWADAHGAHYEQIKVWVITIDGIDGITDGQEVG